MFYMFYVYVLISLKDHKLYTGYTGDLEKRIQEHFSGRSIATKDRRPFKLIYFEAYLEECEAKKRERYLKGGNGRANLKIQLSVTLKKYGYKYLQYENIRSYSEGSTYSATTLARGIFPKT